MSSRAASAILFMATANFVLVNGGGFSCYLRPWDCFEEAFRIMKEVNATHVYVGGVGCDSWRLDRDTLKKT